MRNGINEIIRNGTYGAMIGDALGVPYEFTPRQEMNYNPCKGMMGYGKHDQPVGTWSDDSSMILATMDAMTSTLKQHKSIDYDLIMDNYADWVMYGEFTPHGDAFDVGNTVLDAVTNYTLGVPSLYCGGENDNNNGNGSLMRMLPVAYYVYYVGRKNQWSLDEQFEFIHNMSSLTHRHKTSQMSCGTYCMIILEILKNMDSNKDVPLENMVSTAIRTARDYYSSLEGWEASMEDLYWVFSSDISEFHRDEIDSGGYTVSTLEATIWCVLRTDNYKDAVLKAVNLGYDTDTTACTVGGLVGLYYGYEQIPKEWVESLKSKNFVNDVILSFSECLAKYFEGV